MIKIAQTYIGNNNFRALFELLKNGGLISIGQYRVHMQLKKGYIETTLYITGKDESGKVLVNMGSFNKNKRVKKEVVSKTEGVSESLFG